MAGGGHSNAASLHNDSCCMLEYVPNQATKEVHIVSWDGDNDPAAPRNWPVLRKWTIAIVGFAFCGLAQSRNTRQILAESFGVAWLPSPCLDIR